MLIRNEVPQDAEDIARTIQIAFRDAEHSSGTEAQIVDALRRGGDLTVSLVATENDAVVGHVAISPVSVGDAVGWYGLGPVAVLPDWQHNGVGSLLIKEALRQLRACGAAGCVVLGDPEFYGKFGFSHDPNIKYADVPPHYFQVLSFESDRPAGSVRYDAAFEA